MHENIHSHMQNTYQHTTTYINTYVYSTLSVAEWQRPLLMKLLPGQVFRSGGWPCPGLAPLYQNTRLFSVKHELQPWSGLDPHHPLVGTSIILPQWPEPTMAIRSEEFVKGPYQKNTPPAVRLKLVILRMPIQAFYQLSINVRLDWFPMHIYSETRSTRLYRLRCCLSVACVCLQTSQYLWQTVSIRL